MLYSFIALYLYDSICSSNIIRYHAASMCGFAGITRFDDELINEHRLKAMLRHVQHRGPDGDGMTVHPYCGLVHARLSIIDLLSGAQPMHLIQTGSHGSLHLVFNGEIYNHHELRKKLEQRGHRFRSDHSDTEVLLFGYRQWGDMLPKHLHGMFSFAIWDEQQRELFLTRDRTGKKPLYYRKTNRAFLFGSLPATILAGCEPQEQPSINRDALLTYLGLGYCFEQSLLDGIEELPAAHSMLVDATGSCELKQYWQPPPISRTSTAMGAVDAVGEVVTEAVHKRLESDMPLGCFLSGGVDSSLVAAVAQRILRERGEPALKTFTVAMPDLDYDESDHAYAVARHIQSYHTTLRADPTNAMEDLEHLMAVAGEPTADSSILPTYWLCRTTRSHVAVALSGDGGDELFGGYDRYKAMRVLQRLRGLLRCLPANWLRAGDHSRLGPRLYRLVRAAQAGAQPSQQYRQLMELFSDELIVMMLGQSLPHTHEPAAFVQALMRDWPDERDPVHAAMRWDLMHYLPFDMLRKVDRASMAVALEVRCPLLDTQVCDLAGHLPTSVLMPYGQNKGLLKQYAHAYLPKSILGRRKQGFAVPIGYWFRTSLRDALGDRLFDGTLSDMGFELAPIRTMFEQHLAGTQDHRHRLFALLQLSIWGRWYKSVLA